MNRLTKCACRSEDAYRCWEERYGPRDWDVGEVDMDGGPCECPCHDEFYRDEWASAPNKRHGGMDCTPSKALLDDAGFRARAALGRPE